MHAGPDVGGVDGDDPVHSSAWPAGSGRAESRSARNGAPLGLGLVAVGREGEDVGQALGDRVEAVAVGDVRRRRGNSGTSVSGSRASRQTSITSSMTRSAARSCVATLRALRKMQPLSWPNGAKATVALPVAADLPVDRARQAPARTARIAPGQPAMEAVAEPLGPVAEPGAVHQAALQARLPEQAVDVHQRPARAEPVVGDRDRPPRRASRPAPCSRPTLSSRARRQLSTSSFQPGSRTPVSSTSR